MFHPTRTSLLLAALAAAATAQTPVKMIGGSVNGGGPFIQNQQICTAGTSLCSPVLGIPPVPWAGGTAYDPIRGVIWDTDGIALIGISGPQANVAPCAIVCPPQPAPGIPAGSVMTGLAFEEDGSPLGALWALDDGAGLQRLTWNAAGCPTPGPRCNLTPFMPTPAHRPGGLAVSERYGLVFYSASDFTTGVPNNWVFAAPLTSPCLPNCRLQIGGCAGLALGPITGLAFDDCRSMLYITDGRLLFFGVFTPATPGVACTLVAAGCCPQGLIGAYYGLDLENSHAQTPGPSCLTAPCVVCPGMRLDTNGDAALGNASFGYRLTGAPPGVVALCFFNVGACSPIPVLCGTLFVPVVPSPIMIGSAPTIGGPCAATAFHPLPIPLSGNLCGLPISAQDIILCPTAIGFGTGLSNGVCAQITDN